MAPTKNKTPTTALGGLDYAKCKRGELDVFYKQRLHEHVPKGVKKPELIQILRQKDQDPGEFRFLDLPAEMQNAVYKELLILPQPNNRRSVSTCQPAILQTCRQVYSDASGILYGENEPEVIIEATDYFGHPGSRTMQLRRQCSVPLFSKVISREIATASKGFRLLYDAVKPLWLEQLLPRFHSVIVSIDIVDKRQSGQGSAFRPQHVTAVNHLLYSLCTLLASSPQKRSLTLNLNAQIHLTTRKVLHAALWPVTRLGPATTIQFAGVPTEIQQLLRADCTTNSTSPNLLERIWQAQPRAHMIAAEVSSLAKMVRWSSQMEEWFGIFSAYSPSGIPFGMTGIMDKAGEKKLREEVAKIEQGPVGKLADLIDRNIEKKIKDMEAKVKDMKTKSKNMEENIKNMEENIKYMERVKAELKGNRGQE